MKPLNTLLEGLNDKQQAAVRHPGGPLLILAGPGSGKTRVICHRIAWLVSARIVTAEHVLGITFTNKAANEMRERLGHLLGRHGPTALLSTYHSFCARILRADGARVRVPPGFVIYDATDQLKAARLAIEELDYDANSITPRHLVWQIGQWKNRMHTPEHLRTIEDGHRMAQLVDCYQRYQKILDKAGALDFDDLLLRAVSLLGHHDGAREKYAARYRHLLVDEYQDTNHAQYELTRLLGKDHRNVCVVGDPDQAIYGWRGADIRNIRQFTEDFPEHTVIRLERNYRSTRTIVGAAAMLIAHNDDRASKTLWTRREDGAAIGYVSATTDHNEADIITGIVRAEPAEPRRTAVLYRTNAQSRLVEDALRRSEIPYHIVGNIRFYERREIKDALAYLKVVINPHDEVSLRRIINSPARGIGPRTVDKAAGPGPAEETAGTLFDAAGDAGRRSLWTRLNEGCARGRLQGRALEKMQAFLRLIRTMRDETAEVPVGDAVESAINRTGYLKTLRDENSTEAADRIDNLMELVSAAEDYQQGAETPTLADFVNRQSLLSEVDEGDGPNDARVWLMTLHAAKGLEFPTVIIAGLEEGLLPHSRNVETESGIEEERRLFYVGMTRAMDRLVITSAQRRRRHRGAVSVESRFLDEVGLENRWGDVPDDQLP
jgi:DNA helicase-2/ATP-dependent DNA helicase PcrA